MTKDNFTAQDIKLRLIAWLLPRLEINEVLASELHFLEGKRRADLALLSSNRLCGIEIKGPRDNLQKLGGQLIDYQSMFLEVYIASSKKHLPAIVKVAPQSVGLISVGAEVTIEREAKVKKALTKGALLKWLSTKDLRSILRSSGLRPQPNDGIDELRLLAAKLSSSQLSHLTFPLLKERVAKRHDAFVRELGKTPTLDDLLMLTIEERVVPD